MKRNRWILPGALLEICLMKNQVITTAEKASKASRCESCKVVTTLVAGMPWWVYPGSLLIDIVVSSTSHPVYITPIAKWINSSNGLASLVDWTRKKFCPWGCGFFVSDVISGGLFGHPGRQPLGGSISLKFLLETRLQSKSFDTLDDLLGFLVQKLWCKLVKIFD